MSEHWAAEKIADIHAFMKRTSVYERALAPVLLLTGALGTAAAGLTSPLALDTPRAFALYWQAVAMVVVVSGLGLISWQARSQGEPMWTPPARQVALALVAPLVSGLILGLGALGLGAGEAERVWAMVVIWLFFYGCGVKAASLTLPRDLRALGWLFILVGVILVAAKALGQTLPSIAWAHVCMGASFGGLHLVFGLGLSTLEKRSQKP